MPYPSDILQALRGAMGEFNMPLAGSLLHKYQTDGSKSCFAFAGAILGRVQPPGAEQESQSGPAHDPAADTAEGTFYHFSLMGDPSSCNHGFCVYFWNNTAVLIQVFADKPVLLIRRMPRGVFLVSFGKLRSGNTVEAYAELFGVEIEPFKIVSFYVMRVS